MQTPAPLTRVAGVLARLPAAQVCRNRDRQTLDTRATEVTVTPGPAAELQTGERVPRIARLGVPGPVEERHEQRIGNVRRASEAFANLILLFDLELPRAVHDLITRHRQLRDSVIIEPRQRPRLVPR